MENKPTEWLKFDGSDELIAEIGMSVYTNGFITKNASGIESNVVCSDTTHFWLIPSDPLREMKIRQAQTGQPVWVKEILDDWSSGHRKDFVKLHAPTTDPDWSIDYAEYSFTPFED